MEGNEVGKKEEEREEEERDCEGEEGEQQRKRYLQLSATRAMSATA